MNRLVCIKDYEAKALSLLDSRFRDYIAGGADNEQTLAENESDFKRWRIRPRMLVDVSHVSLKTSLLGESVLFPVGISPTSHHKLAHHLGEINTAKGAEAMGTCFCLSTHATTSIEDIATSAPQLLKWFQLYILKSRESTMALVRRAETAGYKALIVTIDLPAYGNRRRSLRNPFTLPPHIRAENLVHYISHEKAHEHNPNQIIEDSWTWADLKWLISQTSLPVIVKGVLTGEDAAKAVETGCSAVYVSNHGGRQLDGVHSSIRALPEVVRAVAGGAEVYMDGGVRTGTDVLKALALGAKAVFIGRPVLYGLAVEGKYGVERILSIIKDELKLAMQLSGVTDVHNIPNSLVIHDSMTSRL